MLSNKYWLPPPSIAIRLFTASNLHPIPKWDDEAIDNKIEDTPSHCSYHVMFISCCLSLPLFKLETMHLASYVSFHLTQCSYIPVAAPPQLTTTTTTTRNCNLHEMDLGLTGFGHKISTIPSPWMCPLKPFVKCPVNKFCKMWSPHLLTCYPIESAISGHILCWAKASYGFTHSIHTGNLHLSCHPINPSISWFTSPISNLVWFFWWTICITIT